jgi:hypothetical protein
MGYDGIAFHEEHYFKSGITYIPFYDRQIKILKQHFLKGPIIQEEYLMSFILPYGEELVEVFKNPSKKELRDLGPVVRFTADSRSKTVYAWDADKALHYDVCKQLKNVTFRNVSIFHGVAVKRGGKYILDSSDEFEWGKPLHLFLHDVEELDDIRWINKYIDVDPWIEKMKKLAEKEKSK